jgi:hypothetical protein
MRVNWPIAGLGVLWWWLETRYFGWNRSPGSVAELFADGMALAFFAAAFAFPRKDGLTIVVNQGASDES